MEQQGFSPSQIRYPAWQNEYQAAIFELDPKKLQQRVQTAEAAIFNRLQELTHSSDNPDSEAERRALQNALGALRVLKRDKLDFPDWERK